MMVVFFFQAEDGIRDLTVTGVQTCALPISMAKALELSPRLYVAHVIMGNNYIFGEPRDFTKALGHMQEAEALAPDESNAHMFVGDAYRAQKNLEKAREEYRGATRSSPATPSCW